MSEYLSEIERLKKDKKKLLQDFAPGYKKKGFFGKIGTQIQAKQAVADIDREIEILRLKRKRALEKEKQEYGKYKQNIPLPDYGYSGTKPINPNDIFG